MTLERLIAWTVRVLRAPQWSGGSGGRAEAEPAAVRRLLDDPYAGPFWLLAPGSWLLAPGSRIRPCDGPCLSPYARSLKPVRTPRVLGTLPAAPHLQAAGARHRPPASHRRHLAHPGRVRPAGLPRRPRRAPPPRRPPRRPGGGRGEGARRRQHRESSEPRVLAALRHRSGHLAAGADDERADAPAGPRGRLQAGRARRGSASVRLPGLPAAPGAGAGARAAGRARRGDARPAREAGAGVDGVRGRAHVGRRGRCE